MRILWNLKFIYGNSTSKFYADTSVIFHLSISFFYGFRNMYSFYFHMKNKKIKNTICSISISRWFMMWYLAIRTYLYDGVSDVSVWLNYKYIWMAWHIRTSLSLFRLHSWEVINWQEAFINECYIGVTHNS